MGMATLQARRNTVAHVITTHCLPSSSRILDQQHRAVQWSGPPSSHGAPNHPTSLCKIGKIACEDLTHLSSVERLFFRSTLSTFHGSTAHSDPLSVMKPIWLSDHGSAAII